MNEQQEQLPKTNVEGVVYYQSILAEFTDEEKAIGSAMSVDDFAELPLKRKQKYLKKLYSHIDEHTSSE
ncbi:MAG: hypothetical protein O3C61_04570 [Proteobacteria bacterium]|nr:hypothetical protein [Pseudomonadota bacterium]